jgi:integrase
MQIDDDIRWLVALVSDTGMRLAEAAGLSLSDFNLQGDIPFRGGASSPVAQSEDVC